MREKKREKNKILSILHKNREELGKNRIKKIGIVKLGGTDPKRIVFLEEKKKINKLQKEKEENQR